MQSLVDRVAVVTGGGTGIGQAIAVALARAGSRVVIAGRRPQMLEAAARAAGAEHPLHPVPCDVTDRPSVAALVGATNERFGPIDILVNAAGVNIKTRTMAAMSPEQWDMVMQINATGVYNCLHAVLPQMRERRSGTVVNISSVAGKRALALGGIAYCASKFAVTALGTAVGTEVASDGIRVSNVYPGEVDTPILEQRPTPVSDEHRRTMLQPQDVAQMVLAICSLPPYAHVPEVVVKPLTQPYV